jgi:hypothetical protein
MGRRVKRSVPIKRRRTTKRRTTTPRCSVRGCNKPAKIRGWCVSHAEQVADRLFSRWVRDRDGRCTAAGVLDGECKGILQAAHVVGRRNHAVRFNNQNVHALCAAHHYTVDQHGQENAKYRWASSVIGEKPYVWLMDYAHKPVKRILAIEDALSWLASPGGTKE